MNLQCKTQPHVRILLAALQTCCLIIRQPWASTNARWPRLYSKSNGYDIAAYRKRVRLGLCRIHTMSVQPACVAYLLTHFPCFVCLWLSASMVFVGCKYLAKWFIGLSFSLSLSVCVHIRVRVCVCIHTECCLKKLADWFRFVFVQLCVCLCVSLLMCVSCWAVGVTQAQLLWDWLCHCERGKSPWMETECCSLLSLGCS